MRRQPKIVTIGYYSTAWWESKLNKETGRYEQNKPKHRSWRVRRCTGVDPHPDQYYRKVGMMQTQWEDLTEESILAAEMTVANSSSEARTEQAAILAHHGYGGPVSGGEARALKNLFAELGFTGLVKRGWARVPTKVMRPPSRWQIRNARRQGIALPASTPVEVLALRSCYVFKSPMEGIPFDKFIKLARMYKDDDGKLKVAVKALLDNPDAHKEVETIDAIAILAQLGGISS